MTVRIVKFSLLVFFIFIIFQCCESNDRTEISLVSIDVVKAFEDKHEILSSSLFESFEYVKLEYSESTLIKNIKRVDILGDTALLIKGFRRISIFDKSDGRYVKDIGHYGSDPNGYSNSLNYSGVNHGNTSTYATGWKDNFLEYSLKNNQIVNTIFKPVIDDAVPFESEMAIASFTKMDDSHFLGYVLNYSGNEKFRLVIFKQDGEIVKTYPNHLTFQNTSKIVYSNIEGSFYKFDNATYFKEYYNDTLYRVTLEKMSPVLKFDLGKNSPPYAEKESMKMDGKVNYMFIKNILETEKELFFQIDFKKEFFFATHNKEKGLTKVSHLEIYKGQNKHGIINDLDDFIPFFPMSIYKDSILGLVSAEDVYYWFMNNPEKISSLLKSSKI